MTAPPDQGTNPPPDENAPGGPTSDRSLTLRDYLETATDSSRRTRFITIAMVVACVLLFVSVLNSAPEGWITLRLKALSDPTSDYALEKFPLLCKCGPLPQGYPERVESCKKFGKEKIVQIKYQEIDRLEAKLAPLEIESAFLKSVAWENSVAPAVLAGEPTDSGVSQIREWVRVRQEEIDKEITAPREKREQICDEEMKRLTTFHDALLRSAAETKYTVRVPFFGVALDINDIGLLGGLSLLVILIMLRLSLRNQIVSLRVGFKAARASDQERWFYEILAARQVFVFPYLEDRGQRASVAMGWTEALWRKSIVGRGYRFLQEWAVYLLEGVKGRLDKRLNLDDGGRKVPVGVPGGDMWSANRTTPLRIVPKLLCLLPALICALQLSFDYSSRHYGEYVQQQRTEWLLRFEWFFLCSTLIFGVWCVIKWNELDKLWDYFKKRIDWGDQP
jgi:hypothetical protein